MSYHGLGFSLDPAVLGREAAKWVVPPVTDALRAEVPGFLNAVQPTLQAQGAHLLQSLQPQLEKQAAQTASSLQPFLDKQLSAAESRLGKVIDKSVARIAEGEALRKLKRQAVIALTAQMVVILGGMYVIETRVGRK